MTFTPNFKSLPSNQLQTWEHLSAAKEIGFCLYGGTALALRYGHRESIDFDFFSDSPLNKNLLMEKLPILKGVMPIQNEQNTYVALVTPPHGKGTVKLSFFGDLSFGRVGTPELSLDGILLAASIKDLMATKLKVLLDRVEIKDYLDIAEMLDRGVNLSDGICDAMALFKEFNPVTCLKALCYFEDELSGLDEGCKKIITKAVQLASTTPLFTRSPKISTSLILSSNEMVAEMELVKPNQLQKYLSRGQELSM